MRLCAWGAGGGGRLSFAPRASPPPLIPPRSLVEHTGGKWPLWLSPRQVAIVPVALKYLEYAQKVAAALMADAVFVDVDATTNTLNKKIREAQVEQYNYIVVVGAEEEAAGTVNVRTRMNERVGTMPVGEFREKVRGEGGRHE